MKINQKIRYALLCLIKLGEYPNEFIGAEFISESKKIPFAFTQKILNQLGHKGLVFSLKGAGYRLARPLDQISVMELFDCFHQEGDDPTPRNELEMEFERRINNALDSISLSDFVMHHSQL